MKKLPPKVQVGVMNTGIHNVSERFVTLIVTDYSGDEARPIVLQMMGQTALDLGTEILNAATSLMSKE